MGAQQAMNLIQDFVGDASEVDEMKIRTVLQTLSRAIDKLFRGEEAAATAPEELAAIQKISHDWSVELQRLLQDCETYPASKKKLEVFRRL